MQEEAGPEGASERHRH